MDFITSLSNEYPEIKYVLTPRILEALDADINSPYKDDLDYLKISEADLRIKIFISELSDVMSVTFRNIYPSSKKIDGTKAEGLQIALKKVQEQLKSIKNAKLEQHAKTQKRLPRIVRLCERLKLAESESKIMEFILLYQIATPKLNVYNDAIAIVRILFEKKENHSTLLNIHKKQADFNGLSIKEVLQFLDGNREHVKQGLFEYFEPDRPLQTPLAFATEVIMALIGADISDEARLKIDNTELAEVLNDEDPNRKSLKESKGSLEEPSQISDDQDFPMEYSAKQETDLFNESYDENQENERADEPIEDTKQESVIKSTTDESVDIHDFLKLEIEREKLGPQPTAINAEEGESKLLPYRSDLDYLETETAALFALFQIVRIEQQKNDNRVYSYGSRDDYSQEAKLRELRAQSRILRKKADKRLQLTREAGAWIPRVERIAEARKLDLFEKQTILALVSSSISNDFHALGHRHGLSVGQILQAFCENFEQQIKARSYFYKNSKLILEGIVKISGGTHLDSDLPSAHLQIDRRMLEFTMGLDTEFNELVEGSHLYYPKVQLDTVILPEEQKKLILETVVNFETYKKARKRMGFDDVIPYGSGIVLLFYGASGTGKTMMANSIANHLKKKILLINFPTLGRNGAGEVLKYIFREAKISDAILFFDECESIFESREKGNYNVNMLLTEIERHDNLVIMATNRSFDLDEAMHRRVTLAVEFFKPDPILRERVWKANIPSGLALDKDVDLKVLAMNFELTGGFIKNAILSALAIAVSRDGENAVIRQSDLEHGARLQLRGRLAMVDFHHRLVPSRGLESIILPKEKIDVLVQIINFEKARQILFSQWGFDKVIGQDRATTALFHGPPGTGKSLAAEAIAFSTGKPLKVLNVGELLSKWVGESAKNINAVFEEASSYDAVLVFDEAEGLFGARTSVSSATDRYANVDVGLLLYHMEHFSGVVILCTNLVTELDPALFRRMKFVLGFEIPKASERAQLWKSLIPPACPLDSNIDFQKLANSFEFAGGNIKSAIVRAASRAALRTGASHKVTMEDLEQSAKEESEKTGQSISVKKSMYV